MAASIAATIVNAWPVGAFVVTTIGFADASGHLGGGPKLSIMTGTESKWAKRVREWKASGQTAKEFADERCQRNGSKGPPRDDHPLQFHPAGQRPPAAVYPSQEMQRPTRLLEGARFLAFKSLHVQQIEALEVERIRALKAENDDLKTRAKALEDAPRPVASMAAGDVALTVRAGLRWNAGYKRRQCDDAMEVGICLRMHSRRPRMGRSRLGSLSPAGSFFAEFAV